MDSMEPFGVLLNDCKYMADPANVKQVRDDLTGEMEPRMPPGGPFWSDTQMLFDRSVSGGYLSCSFCCVGGSAVA